MATTPSCRASASASIVKDFLVVNQSSSKILSELPPSQLKRYRASVGIVLLNIDSCVFVGQRCDLLSAAWQMPQGGIEKGEKASDAALRELCEETSITKVDILGSTKDWLSYDFPSNLRPQLWNGYYHGQRQKWFAMRFTGIDQQINIKTKCAEFRTWRWIEIKDIVSTAVDFKRDVYRDVLADFRYQKIIDF